MSGSAGGYPCLFVCSCSFGCWILPVSLFRYVCVCVLQSGCASVREYVFVSFCHEAKNYFYLLPTAGAVSGRWPDTGLVLNNHLLNEC